MRPFHYLDLKSKFSKGGQPLRMDFSVSWISDSEETFISAVVLPTTPGNFNPAQGSTHSFMRSGLHKFPYYFLFAYPLLVASETKI